MSDPSPETWLWGGGGMIAIGAGLKWLWDKIANWSKTREARLENREEKYVDKIEERLVTVETLLSQYSEEVGRLRLSVGILIAKETRADPSSPELAQVRAILGKSFPYHLYIPPEMSETLDKVG